MFGVSGVHVDEDLDDLIVAETFGGENVDFTGHSTDFHAVVFFCSEPHSLCAPGAVGELFVF